MTAPRAVPRLRARRGLLLPVLLCLVASCTTTGALRPREVLDRRTGATLIVAAVPFRFARDQSARALNGRDFLTVYPVITSLGGQRVTRVAVFDWSTLDRRQRPDGALDAPLQLWLDDRHVELGRGTEAREAGIAAWPLERPGRGARLRLHVVDEDVLRHWLVARELRLRRGAAGEDPEGGFTPWREADGSASRQALGLLLGEPGLRE